MTHGGGERQIEVPEPVIDLARLIVESERWSTRATVHVTEAELRALKNLREALLEEEHRVRKKSPSLRFTGGTPE